MAETIHIGRKISRIREIRGIKQDHLAIELGISQQTISKIEQSETVEEETLGKIAKVLGVTPQAIKNFLRMPLSTTFTIRVRLTSIVPLTRWTK